MSRPEPHVENSPTAIAVRKWRRGFSRTGILMLVLGGLAIVMPVISSLAVNYLIGTVLTFSGLFAVLIAFSLRGSPAFLWTLISGLFPLCVGLYFLFLPDAALVTVTALIAALLLLTGISQGVFAFGMRGLSGWIWPLLSSAVSIALGVFILVSLSESSRILLGTVLGVDLISTGLALILIASVVPPIMES